jgi:hypothetical protein
MWGTSPKREYPKCPCQEQFDAANLNFVGRITTDNYEIVDGQLIMR